MTELLLHRTRYLLFPAAVLTLIYVDANLPKIQMPDPGSNVENLRGLRTHVGSLSVIDDRVNSMLEERSSVVVDFDSFHESSTWSHASLVKLNDQ